MTTHVSKSPGRPSGALALKIEELSLQLDQQLAEPGPVLDLLITMLAKGHPYPELWQKLHEAALRDDKLAELAFAYEGLGQDRRIKVLPPEQQAEIFLHALDFFRETFGDPDGAISYGERALNVMPTHPVVVRKLAELLEAQGYHLRLARLYVELAGAEKERDEQLRLLRTAAQLAEAQPAAAELKLEIYQRILRVEPADRTARGALEKLYLNTGKPREAAKLLEQALVREPPPGANEALAVRERLIAMYMGELGDPQRAMPHVEALLTEHPEHDPALRAAEALLENKAVSPRAAAALSDAYERRGDVANAAAMLTQELKIVRGPRRVDVQRRLGILKQDHLGDLNGALELLAPVVAGDPGDDELRQRYVALSLQLDRTLDAARLLSRALQTAREPAVRARVGAEVGNIYLRAGDPKRAQATFQQVIEIGNDEGALLEAATRLSELYGDTSDVKLLAAALEVIARLETQKEPRHKAARRLARLCEGELADPTRAIVAYRALLDSPWVDDALAKLEALYERDGNYEGLVEVLERRAERTRAPEVARELRVRAAELRGARTRDKAGAIAAWQSLIEAHGPAREIHEKLLPLLEQEKRWADIARLLEREAELVPESERAPVLARLGQLRLSRLGELGPALVNFRQALELDPRERAARAAMEKLLVSGDVRLEAAAILEPVYRQEPVGPGLVKVLETRGELAGDASARLAAFAEAVQVAHQGLGNAERALELAFRGLREAVHSERTSIGYWLDIVQRLAAELGDVPGRAKLLGQALGDRAVDSDDMLLLARASGDASMAAGDVRSALEAYRRALSYQPGSSELLAKMDEVLAQQGNPHERLNFYRAALEQQPDAARRRELLHGIAALLRREVGDVAGAVDTWRTLIQEDPKDIAAHQALVDAFAEQQDWHAVYAELERVLVHLEGERRSGALQRMAEVSARQGDIKRALMHYRELLQSAQLSDEVLAAIEQLARSRSDAETTRIVLERRVARATEADEQAELLERLGDVQNTQLGDDESAVRSWMQSARLSETAAPDEARARRLYERVLEVAPSHREAAERLFDMYARTGEWERIPGAFKVMLRGLGSDHEPTNLLLELEEQATRAGAFDAFAALADAVLELDIEPGRARQLLLAKARVLSQNPARHEEVDFVYRRLLEAGSAELSPVADSFEQFLRSAPLTPARLDSLRWLYAWRSQHASDPVAALMTWAAMEEQDFADLEAASRLYERVVELNPERSDALAELARLRAARGDAEGSLRALQVLRQSTVGDARNAVDLSLAGLLIDALDRPMEALSIVEPLLDSSPPDADALRIVHRALARPEARGKAAELLERTAAMADDPQAGAEVLEVLLNVSTGSLELSEARRRWYERLLDYRSNDPERALELALAAAEEFPTAFELWDTLDRAARRLNRPEPVADAYARAIDRALRPEDAEELGRRLVEFHEEWFEDPDRVVRLLERVLALCPSAGWAFDRLKLAFNASGRWPELFDLYDRGLSHATDASARVELLREAAMAAKDFAGDADRAVGYLEQLNQTTPGDLRVELALERLYERSGRTRPLIELLSARLKTAPPATVRGLELRIAVLWLDLGEPLPAFGIASRLFAAHPADSEVVLLLERLVELPAARDSRVPAAAQGALPASAAITVREGAAALLIDFYHRAGDTRKVVRLMEVLVDTAEARALRVERLKAVAQVRIQELGDVDGAFQNVAALVVLEPQETEYRQQLAELANSREAQSRRAELLVRVAGDVSEPALVIELLNEAARVYERELGDEPRAIELYLRVLELDVSSGPAALSAARQLDVLLDRAEQPERRCTVLERLAELEPDANERRRVLGTAARVAFEQLGDPNRAVRTWQARLAEDAADREALDGLCAALERAGRFEELVGALERRADASSDPNSARRDWVRVAKLQAQELGDPARAIVAWQRVRERFARDRESFELLARLLEHEQRWPELCVLVAEEADTDPDPARQVLLRRQLGEIHRDRTGDVLAAVRAFVSAEDWERAIEVAGSSTPNAELGRKVCEELLTLAIAYWTELPPGSPAAMSAAEWAIEELAARLAEAGDFEQIVALLLRGAELPFDRKRQREFRREAACLCSDRLGETDRALDLFRGLFAEDPGDEVAIGSVTRTTLLLEERGLDEEIVTLWEQQARCREQSRDLTAAAALWARAGERCEERLADTERAIRDYKNGAGLGGESSLEALARIYETRGDHQQAAEVLEWLCAQSPREALSERALRLSNAYVAAGLRKRARARLEQAAATAIDAGAVRRKLGELYREAGEWGPLADLLTAEAQRAGDLKSRLGYLREAASLHVYKRRDPASAVPLLEQAVELEPDDASLRLALSEALLGGERYDEASAILREQIDRYGARRPKHRALVHFQLARVSLAAGRRAEAIAELDVATKIDPAHPGILQALARLAFEEDQLDRAERMYRALLLVLGRDPAVEGPSRAEALLDLSEIAVRKDDPMRATEFVESAFEAALEHPKEAEALEQSLRQRGRHELLARALETRLNSALAPEQTARALSDLVLLQAGKVSTTTQAQMRARADATTHELEQNASTDDEAWAALGRVYDWLGDADAESRVLERRVQARLQVAGDDGDPDPLYRLAEVRLREPNKREQGLDLLERALDIRPDFARAEQMLSDLVDAAPHSERLVRLYERVARRSGDDRALLRAIVRTLGLPQSSAESVREGVELARKLDDAELLEALLRGGAATLDRYAPEDAAWLLRELAELHEQQRDLGQALELRERAASYEPPEQARASLLRVARASSAELKDFARAARIYESLLAREPADREIWEPLFDIYRRLGRKDELVRLIDQTVPLVDSAQDRARLRFEQAQILLEQPTHLDEAIEVFREILAEDPGQLDAAIQLSTLYERAQRHDELAELLTLQLNAAKDREEVAAILSLSRRLGGLLEQQGRLDDALDVYHGALDWSRSDADTLHSVLRLAEQRRDSFMAAEAVEGLLSASTLDAPEQQRLLTRLLELRTEQGDEAGVERALELGVKAMPSNHELRERLIALYAGRSDWPAVARVLRGALQQAPGDGTILRRLVEAYRAGGEHEAAASVLDELVSAGTDEPALYRERAALLTELGRHEEALRDFESAYERDPSLTPEYVSALENAISRAEDGRYRELVLRLCDVLLERGEVEAARSRLLAYVKEAPKDRDGLRRLAALESRLEHWDAASLTYRKLIALDEGETLVDSALRLAEACERAGRASDARAGLERALLVSPTHVELRAKLRDILIALGANREVAQMLLEDAAGTADVSERLEYLLAAGEWLLAPEGDAAKAIKVLEEARALSPENLEGIVLLARGYASGGRTEDAMRLLGDVAAAQRGRRVKTMAPIFQEMSRIQLEEGMLSDALESLTKAFEMDVRNGPLAMEVARLALEIDEHEAALRAFRSIAMMKAWDPDLGEGASSEDKADAHYYLAQSAKNQGDSRKAKILLAKALSENPEHELAKQMLAELGGGS